MCLFSLGIFNESFAEITVVDDIGHAIKLNQPAKRIVSLSPGITELLFAAGGGANVKGVVSYSDFPEAAKKLPQVGSYNAVDIEKILSLNPDLVVAWKSGNPPLQISKLKKLGLNVFTSEPRNFDNIPDTLVRFGKLMNTESSANKAASDFQDGLSQLTQKYSKDKTKPKSVYIQIWNKPIMTINGEHLISKIFAFCNGHNIFHDVPQLTLNLDVETILQKNPDVIFVTRDGDLGEQWLSQWRKWDFLKAVESKELFAVNPDHLVRHTPRILKGIEQVCGFLHPKL